jgi:hypothetical protein
MRLIDEPCGEILVGHDPARSAVEIQIAGAMNEARRLRLTRQEARRLAALILFQAERLERPRAIA